MKACCCWKRVTACATMRLKHASCRVLQPMWSIRAPVHTLVQMVANGLGVTLLPMISVAADVLGDTDL